MNEKGGGAVIGAREGLGARGVSGCGEWHYGGLNPLFVLSLDHIDSLHQSPVSWRVSGGGGQCQGKRG